MTKKQKDKISSRIISFMACIMGSFVVYVLTGNNQTTYIIGMMLFCTTLIIIRLEELKNGFD